MMLPKTVEEVIVASRVQDILDEVRHEAEHRAPFATTYRVNQVTTAVLAAAGIKIADDGQTLIYPATQGTNTPRYQIAEQRNVRSHGRKARR